MGKILHMPKSFSISTAKATIFLFMFFIEKLTYAANCENRKRVDCSFSDTG